MRATILASVVLAGVAFCGALVSVSADNSPSSPTCSDRGFGEASREEPRRAEVLVLGVYHMANPGFDIYNMRADDVRTPKRQQEIEELVTPLKKFKPTKIAIEHDYNGEAQERYRKYLAGQYLLAAEETDQIGFRLAKDLGHRAIYPINVDGDFPIQRVIDYAKATGQSERLEAQMREIGDLVKGYDEYLKTHTVLQTLLNMNSDAKAAQYLGWYYLIARYGESGDYAGPDLLAEWYRRNVRIYSNVAKLVTSPEDRILVIYGYGHLAWLRQDVAANPTLRLRKLEEFIPAPLTPIGKNRHQRPDREPGSLSLRVL